MRYWKRTRLNNKSSWNEWIEIEMIPIHDWEGWVDNALIDGSGYLRTNKDRTLQYFKKY